MKYHSFEKQINKLILQMEEYIVELIDEYSDNRKITFKEPIEMVGNVYVYDEIVRNLKIKSVQYTIIPKGDFILEIVCENHDNIRLFYMEIRSLACLIELIKFKLLDETK